jgi:hypothetical protein
MKRRRITRAVILAIVLLTGIHQNQVLAQKSSETVSTPYRVELNVDKLGIDISPTLNGIFFEDINYSNDGGISAQLIQNNSFQAYNVPGSNEIGPANNKFPEFSKSPTDIYGWSVVKNSGATGTATIVDDKPLVTYRKIYNFDENDQYDDALKYKQYCVRINIEKPGDGYGLAANGFGIGKNGSERQGFYYSNNTQIPSIAVNAGEKYNLGLYLQGKEYKGTIIVYLEDSTGKPNSKVIKFKGLADNWKKFTGKLTAQRSVLTTQTASN